MMDETWYINHDIILAMSTIYIGSHCCRARDDGDNEFGAHCTQRDEEGIEIQSQSTHFTCWITKAELDSESGNAWMLH